MKTYMILVLTSCFLSSFILCESESHNSLARSSNHFTSPITTLDSIIGVWVSSKDTKYRMIISNDTLYNIYDGEPMDTAKFFIADDCTNPLVSSYDKTKMNGSFIITYTTGKSNYDLCYKISYLSPAAIELVYDNKYLGFNRE